MSNLYGSDAMASGYARWRPAVHPHVIALVRARLSLTGKLARALDIGCGSGLSTAALTTVARQCIGLEPTEAMLRWSSSAAPDGHFAVARAEQLPIASASIDLITAAGSLNYVDLGAFFPEARRVLVPGGHLVVYDFGPGRSFVDSPALDEWFGEFEHRYPFPLCRDIGPKDLEAESHGLKDNGFEPFRVTLTLSPEFFVEYAMTETSVAAAISRGTPVNEIRRWCESTLTVAFGGVNHDVAFSGYTAYLLAA